MTQIKPDKAIEHLQGRSKRLDDMLLYEANRLSHALSEVDRAHADIIAIREEKDDVSDAIVRLQRPKQRDPRFGGRD